MRRVFITAGQAGRMMGCAMLAMALTFVLTTVGAAAQGKPASELYLDKCAVCHGADGAGKTAKGRKLKLADVRQTVVKFTAAQMIDVVAKGKAPDMDGFSKEFSADQITQIVEYYRGLAKK